MLRAGAGKIDITPKASVRMDGMIRSHKSDGVHDPLFARALVLSDGSKTVNALAILSVDICALPRATAEGAKRIISCKTGVPKDNIIIAATHTHSGPAAFGFFNPVETQYVNDLVTNLAAVTSNALGDLRPAALACASGREDTISFYRRFKSGDGRTVMIWEENPATNDLQVLGEPDDEVGVLKVVDAAETDRTIAVVFNHAGHPNVMSGDNYMISADYPGVAARTVEEELGAVAMFINGAQGTVDIDNWTYRDWGGMEHIGEALAEVVISVASKVEPSEDLELRSARISYAIPSRKITDEELRWAEQILASTGGAISSVADGVGDDYKALLYKKLREAQANDVHVEQTCIAIGDAALITFPGELFTEIGMRIKAEGPYEHTYVLGLANGCVGYIPTIESIPQRGYEVDTRVVCDDAERIIVEHSLALLNQVRL